jgi:hypothetical protein
MMMLMNIQIISVFCGGIAEPVPLELNMTKALENAHFLAPQLPNKLIPPTLESLSSHGAIFVGNQTCRTGTNNPANGKNAGMGLTKNDLNLIQSGKEKWGNYLFGK